MIDFLTDPVMRAPIWGCTLMCVATSLMGVVVFLQKRSLLSEALSHAAYPGACVGMAFFALLFPMHEEWAFVAVIAGAFLSALLGLKTIQFLEKRVRTDSALCFVLSLFFGVGIVIASAMQIHLPVWYRQVQLLLFGQAATMQDLHIWIYGTLAAFVCLFLWATFRPLQALLFDRNFSMSAGLRTATLEKGIFWLLLLILIVGIRSVGVVLMSGMVIAPAVAARCWSHQLKTVFCLAALFGATSGLVGASLDLPTGPAIVLIATAIALFSLLFAPKRGLLFRFLRIGQFHLRCLEENILKAVWKKGTFAQAVTPMTQIAFWHLRKGGWVDGMRQLTPDGKKRAARIVRLHRLFELYLAESLGVSLEKVHRTAEEMEHILTEEMEERLNLLLENPTKDPHDQPIPERRS